MQTSRGALVALGCTAAVLCLSVLLLAGSPSASTARAAELEQRKASIMAQHTVLKVLAPTAKLLANSMLFTAVAQHARSNPKSPGRAAMEAVLGDTAERAKISMAVENKLSNVRSGSYAEEINREVPSEYRSLIPSLAKTAAVSATTMAFIDLRGNVLKSEDYPESMDTGYLESGDSLPDMPILLGSGPRGEYGRVNKSELEFHCRSKCEANHACLAFTYKPSEGVCYLKSKMNPVRGTDCKEDCWFFGVVKNRLG